MPRIIYLLILITIPLTSIQSNDDIGYKYYQKGQYNKALEVWQKEAADGEKEALYNIGLLYFFGKGVAKNTFVAFDYCRRAALMGSARAQNNLAYMHMNGLGTKKNLLAAYAWSVIALENGYNSQSIRDNARMHFTPAMQQGADKLLEKIKKKINYE